MADFAKSLQVAENMLTAHPEVDGVFASNESSTVRGCAGTQAAPRPDQDGRFRLESHPGGGPGIRASSIPWWCRTPSASATSACGAALEKINGGTPRKVIDLPPMLVSKENLHDPAVQKQLNPDLKSYL